MTLTSDKKVMTLFCSIHLYRPLHRPSTYLCLDQIWKSHVDTRVDIVNASIIYNYQIWKNARAKMKCVHNNTDTKMVFALISINTILACLFIIYAPI